MRILVASSSRADFGLLISVIRDLNRDPLFQVAVCEVGTHISRHSENFQSLRDAGVTKLSLFIDAPLGDTPDCKAQFVTSIVTSLTSYFSTSATDAIFILGDRYETLAIAYAASLSNIPIIHLVGGDLTHGSIDDNYRHAITKLARVHFVTNIDSYSRVLQLGEESEFVYVSGSPGLDDVNNFDFVSQESLEETLGIKFKKNLILVTFHPDSINPSEIENQVTELTKALEQFLLDSTIILTGANYDSGYITINEMLKIFAVKHPNSVKFIENLGTRKYLSLMKIASIMVGNSSSGYYEAPSFSLPVVDLGNRQKGRIAHELLTNVPIESEHIVIGMNLSMNQDRVKILNPYGDGKSSVKIREFLKTLPLGKLKSPKNFVNLPPKGLN